MPCNYFPACSPRARIASRQAIAVDISRPRTAVSSRLIACSRSAFARCTKSSQTLAAKRNAATIRAASSSGEYQPSARRSSGARSRWLGHKSSGGHDEKMTPESCVNIPKGRGLASSVTGFAGVAVSGCFTVAPQILDREQWIRGPGARTPPSLLAPGGRTSPDTGRGMPSPPSPESSRALRYAATVRARTASAILQASEAVACPSPRRGRAPSRNETSIPSSCSARSRSVPA